MSFRMQFSNSRIFTSSIEACVVVFLLSFAVPAFAEARSPIVMSGNIEDETSLLNFACNAGNTGNVPFLRKLRNEGMSVSDVLNGILTIYNGDVTQSLRLLLVRITNGSVTASGTSKPRAMKPGEVIRSSQFGYPDVPRLKPETGNTLSSEHVRFVREHIDAARFLAATKKEFGKEIISMLKLRNATDVLVIAIISTDIESGADHPFTMHPAVIYLEESLNR